MELVLRGTDTLDAAIEGPPRLLKSGRPTFNLEFYAVNARDDLGAASFYPSRYAAHDGREGALRDTAHLFAQVPS